MPPPHAEGELIWYGPCSGRTGGTSAPMPTATPNHLFRRSKLRRLARSPRAARLPSDVQPMLCTLVAEPFDDTAWLFEPKLDGLRVLCRFDGKRATIVSRNDKPQDFQFPDIVDALNEAIDRPA